MKGPFPRRTRMRPSLRVKCDRYGCPFQGKRADNGIAPRISDSIPQFFMVPMVPRPSNWSSLVTSVRSMI